MPTLYYIAIYGVSTYDISKSTLMTQKRQDIDFERYQVVADLTEEIAQVHGAMDAVLYRVS